MSKIKRLRDYNDYDNPEKHKRQKIAVAPDLMLVQEESFYRWLESIPEPIFGNSISSINSAQEFVRELGTIAQNEADTQ